MCIISLCSQKWLAVVSLDDPDSAKALRKLARQNKYDIKAVLWNPIPSHQALLASTVSVDAYCTSGKFLLLKGFREPQKFCT